MLLRHAQSGNNLLWERTGGSTGRAADPPITDLGRAQAAALATALAEGRYAPPPRHLYTSLMLRAVQTAAPVAEALDLPLQAHLEAYELFGPVEFDHPDRMTWHPGAGRDRLTEVSPRLVWPDGVPPEGWWAGPVEDPEHVADRARRVVADLVARHGAQDDVVAVVTHGTFTQYLLREVLGAGSMTGWVRIDNASVCLVSDLTPAEAATVVWVSRTDHLAPGQVTR